MKIWFYISLILVILLASYGCRGSSEIEMTERRQEILDVLATLGEATFTEIHEAIGQNRGKTYQRLQDLVRVGMVIPSGTGKGTIFKLR